jgi:hypothetical protein
MSPKMKAFSILVPMICLSLLSCEKPKERMLVEEIRKKTTKDVSPKMFATSNERFRDIKPSPVEGNAPNSWVVLPAKQFRLLNYRFGESGQGEVYVSLSSGTVRDNANRWLKQFGREEMKDEEFAGMEKIPVVGIEGVWVEQSGEYGAGMGADAKQDYGLSGVIAEVDGQILTVKMVGPANEVDAEKQALRHYISTLHMTGH